MRLLAALLFASAVAANAARVTITGIVADRDPALVQGILHTMEGWVIFAVDLAMLIVLHKLINWAWQKWAATPKTVEVG